MGISLGQLLICIGLCLDIAGVILIYLYGLPSRYPKDEGEGQIIWPGIPPTRADPRVQRKFMLLSHLGLVCLVFGFALQIIGIVIPNC